MTQFEKRARVFCTISAQHDNLGDIVIRQRMIDMITHSSVEVHVSVASMPADYLDAFSLPADAHVYRSSRSFIGAFLHAALRNKTSIVFPPGPYPVTTTRGALRGLASVFLSRVARVRGGASITLGKAVRGRHRGAVLVERLLVRSSDVYTTRDEISAAHIGVDVTAVPDLSLLARPHGEPPKRYVVMSFRSDKTVSVDFVRAVGDWSRGVGLEPIFVTQVRRDERNHQALADASGAQHLAWADKTHRQQMNAIMAIYAHAAVVVSDRLHSALLGVLGGAVPVAVCTPDEPSKIVDALSGILPCLSVERQDPAAVAGVLSSTEALEEALLTQRESARQRLRALQADVQEAISSVD